MSSPASASAFSSASAGVTNFGFIIFQAAGAYIAAVLALPSDSANGGFQLYIGGLHLPFPFPWIGAAVAGAALALPFTFLVGRRLRGDFAAVGLLVTAVLLNLLVMNYRPLFNGDAGLALVPAPLQSQVMTTTSDGLPVGVRGRDRRPRRLRVYWFVRHITESPYGRTLRAMRDNDKVADSLGKNLLSLRTGDAPAGRSDCRPVRRRTCQLHQRLVARRLDLRRDHRPVRRGDHRRARQPPRRRARRAFSSRSASRSRPG